MQGWRNLRAIREGRVVAVPADLLSRPSPNIGLAAEVLRSAMHPQFRRRWRNRIPFPTERHRVIRR